MDKLKIALIMSRNPNPGLNATQQKRKLINTIIHSQSP